MMVRTSAADAQGQRTPATVRGQTQDCSDASWEYAGVGPFINVNGKSWTNQHTVSWWIHGICDVAGYAYSYDTDFLGDPGFTVNALPTGVACPCGGGPVPGAAIVSSQFLPDAPTYYFHFRFVDHNGNWGPGVWPETAGPFGVDTTPPVNPVITSPSHTPNVPSSNPELVTVWNHATDIGGSGVDGYSVALIPVGVPFVPEPVVGIPTGFLSPFTFTIPYDGTWQVLVRTRDNVGNWSTTAAFGPYILDTTPEPVCGDAALIGVRGSGDNNHGEHFLGYPGHHAQAIGGDLSTLWPTLRLHDDDGDAYDGGVMADDVIGLNYPAAAVDWRHVGELAAYSLSVNSGITSLLAEIDRLRDLCGPQLEIVLVGYSQGAEVVQTVLDQLDARAQASGDPTWESIGAIILFASPRFHHEDITARGTFVADFPWDGIRAERRIPDRFTPRARTYCLDNDVVCVFTPGNFAFLHVHGTGYDDEVLTRDASTFIAWQLGLRLNPQPTGNLSAYRQNALNRVRISAASIYPRGAPAIRFRWDFTTDGRIDQTTEQAYTFHNYGICVGPFCRSNRVVTTVRIDLANGTSLTRRICIRRAPTGTVTC
jgi:hypothetical protein